MLATLATLSAQSRQSAGGSSGRGSAGGSEAEGMSEESYQALLQQARARSWPSLDSAHCAARRQFEELGATDPGLAGFLDTMMSQLLSKSVLYEPLQQINARARGLFASSLLCRALIRPAP